MRQYIGARYVPKFMGTYDPTQAYEALCVVDNGMGTSYISKIPTPANTPLTDTAHWSIYGASSGAIINLQNQIDNIDQVEIPGINSSIQALTNNQCRYALKRFDKMNVLCIGDSFGSGQVGVGYGSWVTELSGLATFANLHNYCVNSSGYCSGQGNPFKTVAMTAAADLTASDIDLIIIQGGLNDISSGLSDGTTGASDIDDTFTYIKNTFGNAEVLVVPVTWSHTFNGREVFSVGYNLWAEKITEYAVQHGFRVAARPWLWNIGHTDYVGSDNFHPNVLGAKNIAGHILAAILGNDTWSLAMTAGNISAAQYITWRCDGGTIHMHGVLQNVSLPANKQITQAVPEALVPPFDVPLPRMLTNAYILDANSNKISVLAGYQLDASLPTGAQVIFYGDELNTLSQGDVVSVYFDDIFTV